MYARMLSSNAHLKICLLYVTHFKPRVATSRYMYIIYTCTRYLICPHPAETLRAELPRISVNVDILLNDT